MPFVKKQFIVKSSVPAFIFLMRNLELTQGSAQRLIDKGRLLVNGKPMRDKSSYIHGKIEVILFRPVSRDNRPILTTPEFLLFDKPSGVLVHPKKMDTPYSMLDEIRYYGGESANAVHRIDKETSGLLLASRTKEAEKFLKRAFENREIRKYYMAWVKGNTDRFFEVKAPILKNRDYSTTKHKVVVSPYGKMSKTVFRKKYYDRGLDATLLECIPYTGRTHQIRLHLFHVKHPILGDPIYGVGFESAEAYLEGRLSEKERIYITGAPRLMLHAYKLDFVYGKQQYILISRNIF